MRKGFCGVIILAFILLFAAAMIVSMVVTEERVTYHGSVVSFFLDEKAQVCKFTWHNAQTGEVGSAAYETQLAKMRLFYDQAGDEGSVTVRSRRALQPHEIEAHLPRAWMPKVERGLELR